MFFPVHPDCDANSPLHTIKSTYQERLIQWKCLWCGDRFDTPFDSKWFGIEHLDKTRREVWIKREIQGLPPSRIAMALPIPKKAVGPYKRYAGEDLALFRKLHQAEEAV